MIDQNFDRDYQVARQQLNGGIVALARRLGREANEVFDALNRINFSAPWTDPHSR